MYRPAHENRRGVTLLLALLFCGLLGLVHHQTQRARKHDPVTGLVRDMGLVPAQTATVRVDRWWHTDVMALFRGTSLARQNTRLQTQVLALTAENAQLLAAQAENHRLRALLQFQQKSPLVLQAAEVVALKPTPLADTMTLNRGLRNGVHLQTVVLSPEGALVGQVLDVSSASCTVLLLTDTGSSVGAQVLGNGPHAPMGICQGDRAGHLHLTYLRSDAALRPGQSVVTSGLGGIFPKGLPLGTIVSVSVDKTRSLKTAMVRPAADFDHLEEAFLEP